MGGIKDFVSGVPGALEKWGGKFSEAFDRLVLSKDEYAIECGIRSFCARLISSVGSGLTYQLFGVLACLVNYDAQKVWGKKEAFEKVLQSFEK